MKKGRGTTEVFDSIRSIIHLLYSLYVILWQSFSGARMLIKCRNEGGWKYDEKFGDELNSGVRV